MGKLLQIRKSEVLLPVFTISLSSFHLCLFVQRLKLDTLLKQTGCGIPIPNLVSNNRKGATSKGAQWGVTSKKTKVLGLNLESNCLCSYNGFSPIAHFFCSAWFHEDTKLNLQDHSHSHGNRYDVMVSSWSNKTSWVKGGAGALCNPKDALLKSFLTDIIPTP